MPPEESVPAPSPTSVNSSTHVEEPKPSPSRSGDLPAWLDDLGAIVCIIGGIISILALLNIATENALARSWTAALRTLFGEGSLLIAIAITLLGIRLLFPGERRLRTAPRRILGIELAFLALLALFHLHGGEPELASILHRGRGGGLFGWGLGSLARLTGTEFASVIYAFVLLLGIGLAAGLGRFKAAAQFHSAGHWLEALATYFQGDFKDNPSKDEGDNELPRLNRNHEPQLIPLPRKRLMRIKHSTATLRPLPPSRRPRPVAPDIGSHVSLANETPAEVGSIPIAQVTIPRPTELPAIEYLQAEMAPPPEIQRSTELTAAGIEAALREFEIEVDVVDIQVGPTVTQYAIQPYKEQISPIGGDSRSQLIRISKIAALEDDLALALKAKRLRMQAPVPGQRVIGIEIPNQKPQRVTLRSVYESAEHQNKLRSARPSLLVPLGRGVSGQPESIHINALPHLLIAGTTGSGKSVCIAAILTALLLDHGPESLQLVLLDPKMVELTRFQGLPQLVGPVETEPDRIVAALHWCVGEMSRRYQLLEEAAARNLEAYNTAAAETLPHLLIVIDEIGDLMLVKGAEIERSVVRLAQMARAVGMHLIVATQRPSVDVFTGLIKANFPARIAFQVPSGVDSRVVLDHAGAETLLGNGDMLYLAPDASGPRRIQGCDVHDDEIRAIVQHWSAWQAEQIAQGNLTAATAAPWEKQIRAHRVAQGSAGDPLLLRAINALKLEGLASASLLQRRLGLGYPRAARIMDSLDELGLLGEAAPGARGRPLVLPASEAELHQLLNGGP